MHLLDQVGRRTQVILGVWEELKMSQKCSLAVKTHFILTTRCMRYLTTKANISLKHGSQGISPRPSARKNSVQVPSPQGAVKKKKTDLNQLQKQIRKKLEYVSTPSHRISPHINVPPTPVSDLGDDVSPEKMPRVGAKRGCCWIKSEGERRQCMLFVCRI